MKPIRLQSSRAGKEAKIDYEALFAFQCKGFRLPEPSRQHLFALALGRKHRLDFAWPAYKIAVEIDGGIWRPGGGAHSHPIDIERNMTKGNDAVKLKWGVLHFTPAEVQSAEAVTFTLRVLIGAGWNGIPAPL